MKTKHIIYMVSALTLGLVSCQQNDGIAPEGMVSNEMMFDITSPNGTRVSGGAFEAADEIGVWVTDFVDASTPMPLQISGNRANNEVLTFDGAVWNTERTIYWGEGKSDIYAYYPYVAEIADVKDLPFSVATDQSVGGNYETSDFLWAKAEGVTKAEGQVSLSMDHLLSRLVVKIMAGEEYIGSLPKDATVHLHSTVTDARISLATGSVVKDPYGATHSIKMRNLGIHTFAEGDAVVYEAIVVPQMLEGSVPLLEINSKSVSYLLEDAFNFKPATSYTYTAVLNASTTSIKVEIGCEIEDWNNIGGGSGNEGDDEGGEEGGVDLSLYTDLSAEGTANCYMISEAGNYKFKAVKGNTYDTVGNVKNVEVLWETFGTDVMPNVGDLVASAGYQNGYVYFSTSKEFKNGNASIAVRNSKGVILWSWHIWCTEEGWEDHIYANNAGTMMDRNLGATSATPGDVGAFGLLYQWSRKDPFLGACTNSVDTFALSTGSWSVGYSFNTTDLAEENPMTFMAHWSGDKTRWQTSKSAKSQYDPCPSGYRVPDGGKDGFWETAYVSHTYYDSGWTFTLADGSDAWYPNCGCIERETGTFSPSGYSYYWATYETEYNETYLSYMCCTYKYYPPTLSGTNMSAGYGSPIRCQKEKK